MTQDKWWAIALVIGCAIGITADHLLHSRPVSDPYATISDLKIQLQTCNDGREEIHRMLHVMSDSVLLLEKQR